MTLHIVKHYTLTCDECDDPFGPTKPGVNPRPDALANGWRNGRYVTMPHDRRQAALDLCPFCVDRGAYIRDGSVRINRLGRKRAQKNPPKETLT